ncbi:unnamed protein product [Phytomonas sp. Hart1]|nr:unnamed protein product [Phytomonas sp. Hart1]|eukprot:CCW69720.1 unnamed protein product [Phytomonas sp. isolate Hart1]
MRNIHDDLSFSEPPIEPFLPSRPSLLGLPNSASSGGGGISPPPRGLVVLCLSPSRSTNATRHARRSRLRLLSDSTTPSGPVAGGGPPALGSSSASSVVGIAMTNPTTSLSPLVARPGHPLAVYTPYVIVEGQRNDAVPFPPSPSLSHISSSQLRRSPCPTATSTPNTNFPLSTTESLAGQICNGLRSGAPVDLNAPLSVLSMAEGRGGEVITIDLGASGAGKTHFLLGSTFPFPEYEGGDGIYHNSMPDESLLTAVMTRLFSGNIHSHEVSAMGKTGRVEVAVSAIELRDATVFSPVSTAYHPTEAVDLLSGRSDLYLPGSNTAFPIDFFPKSDEKAKFDGVGSSPTGCFMESWTDIPAAQYVCCTSTVEVRRVIGVALSRSLGWDPVRVDGKRPDMRMESGKEGESEMRGEVDGDRGTWFLRPKDRKEHSHLLFTILVRQKTDILGDKCHVDTSQSTSSKRRSIVGVWRLWDLSGPLPYNEVIGTSSSIPSSCSEISSWTFADYTYHALRQWTLSLGCVSSDSQDTKNKVDVRNPSVRMIQACMEESCSTCIFIASLCQDASFDKLNENVLNSAAAWQAWAIRSREGQNNSSERAFQCISQREENLHAARRVLKKFAVNAHTYLHQIEMLPLFTKRELRRRHLASGSVIAHNLIERMSSVERDSEGGGFISTDVIHEFQGTDKEFPRAESSPSIKATSPNLVTSHDTTIDSVGRSLKLPNRRVEEVQHPIPPPPQPDPIHPCSSPSPTTFSHTDLPSAVDPYQPRPLLDPHQGETTHDTGCASGRRTVPTPPLPPWASPGPVTDVLGEAPSPTFPHLTHLLQHWLLELRRGVGTSVPDEAIFPQGCAMAVGGHSPGLSTRTSLDDDSQKTRLCIASTEAARPVNPFAVMPIGDPGVRGALLERSITGDVRQPQFSLLMEAWSKAWGATQTLQTCYADDLRDAQREMDQLWQVVMMERQKSQSLLGRVSQLEQQLRIATRKLSFYERQERGGMGGDESSAPPATPRSAEISSLGALLGKGEQNGQRDSAQSKPSLHPILRKRDLSSSVTDSTATPHVACSFIEKSISERSLEHSDSTAFIDAKSVSSEAAQYLSNLLSRAFRFRECGRDHEQDQFKPFRSNEAEPFFEVQVVPWPDYPSHDESILEEDMNLSAIAQPQVTNLFSGSSTAAGLPWDESLKMSTKKSNELRPPLSPAFRQVTVLDK